MNIYIILSFGASLVGFLLANFIYYQNRKSRLNQLFALLCVAISIGGFCEFMGRQAHDYETAQFWISWMVFWPFALAFYFHFVLIFTEKSNILKHALVYLLIYMPAFIVFYLDRFTNYFSTDEVIQKYWGYTYTLANDSWVTIVVNIWTFGMPLSSLILCFAYYFKATNKRKKAQVKFVIIGTSVTIFSGLTTEVILPFLNMDFPEFTNISMTLMALFVSYAIWRYELFVIDPISVAEHLFTTIPETVFLADINGKIIKVNSSLEELFGYSENEIRGKTIMTLFRNNQTARDIINQVFREKQTVKMEMECVSKSGRGIPVLFSCSSISDKFGETIGMVGIAYDISERKNAEKDLAFMATHDPLTGLPNRMILKDRLAQAIAKAIRFEHLIALILIDLDHFKDTNDTLGHEFGDLLLKSVASLLKKTMRACDTIVRLGGDEFVIVLSELTETGSVKTVAEKLQEAFTRPFLIENHTLRVTLSIGIGMFPSDGSNLEEILKSADLALYKAKDLGRNNFQFFTIEIASTMNERVKIENELRCALERDELELYYQPIYNTDAPKVTALEALLRWNHPRLGLVGPMSFIPIAEKTGLIEPIGTWVIQTACIQNKRWQDRGLPAIPIAVNISARQFAQPNLVENIDRILNETGLESRYLELEITESVAMADIDVSIKIIKRLRDRGIQFMIDDFGSGYSSLGWLKLLPILAIKIDRCFIQYIVTNSYDAAIVKAIILMAHSLGILVVAEGVETREQLEHLHSLRWESMPTLRCDLVQGFLLGKPKPAVDVALLLEGAGTQSSFAPAESP